MTAASTVARSSAGRSPAASHRPPKFAPKDEFRRTLRQRVDAYFKQQGLSPRDCPALYRKSAFLLTSLAVLYLLLVFAPLTWWTGVPLAILMGLNLAAVGFNIQHDGGHNAFSSRRWVNRLAAVTLDLLGASSYVWAYKHNTFHHTYTNVTGHDDDIDVGPVGRLSPHQRRLWFHRFQHLYLWLLYGLLPIKWHLIDDFHDVIAGRIGEHRFPRPRGKNLLIFLGGKVLFFTLAFVVPMLLHPWWLVLLTYAGIMIVMGIVLSVTFQLAHCVEPADFPLPSPDTYRLPAPWAQHQVQTTVDFAQNNRLLTWYVGGLNYQVEHHLLPHVCHIHYPALSQIVRQTCKDFGLPYLAHKSLGKAIASHYRLLRRLGRPAS